MLMSIRQTKGRTAYMADANISRESKGWKTRFISQYATRCNLARPINKTEIRINSTRWFTDTNMFSHTHTHTHIYIYIYIYISSSQLSRKRKTEMLKWWPQQKSVVLLRGSESKSQIDHRRCFTVTYQLAHDLRQKNHNTKKQKQKN